MNKLLCFLLWMACAAMAQAQPVVEFASLDLHEGQPVQLKAYWFPVSLPPGAHAPAVVLLHGCSGMYDRKGRIGERMRDYSQLLNGLGMHVLVLDSLTPRGEKELCTQRIGTRQVNMNNRRLDTLAALQWLAARPDVDATKLGLLGWSNGGSTVLASTNLHHREVKAFPIRPAFAVAFYPGCEADLKRGYEASAPLLMLVGEADDWTPAAPCHQLAQQASGPRPEIEGYAGAYHSFDSTTPVRVRKDVPNGAHPGEGVHMGGNAEALAKSRERLLIFLKEQVGR